MELLIIILIIDFLAVVSFFHTDVSIFALLKYIDRFLTKLNNKISIFAVNKNVDFI